MMEQDKSVESVQQFISALALAMPGVSARRVRLDVAQPSAAVDAGSLVSFVGESGGIVVMKLGAFFFSTTETITRILFSSFPRNGTTFFQGSQVLELNEQVYARLRQDVINKLGDRVEIFIGDLGI